MTFNILQALIFNISQALGWLYKSSKILASNILAHWCINFEFYRTSCWKYWSINQHFGFSLMTSPLVTTSVRTLDCLRLLYFVPLKTTLLVYTTVNLIIYHIVNWISVINNIQHTTNNCFTLKHYCSFSILQNTELKI